MWQVNRILDNNGSILIFVSFSALEAQARLGGEGLKPLFGLIEGGEEGEVFREMEDYFYYAQLRRLMKLFCPIVRNTLEGRCSV